MLLRLNGRDALVCRLVALVQSAWSTKRCGRVRDAFHRHRAVGRLRGPMRSWPRHT